MPLASIAHGAFPPNHQFTNSLFPNLPLALAQAPMICEDDCGRTQVHLQPPAFGGGASGMARAAPGPAKDGSGVFGADLSTAGAGVGDGVVAAEASAPSMAALIIRMPARISKASDAAVSVAETASSANTSAIARFKDSGLSARRRSARGGERVGLGHVHPDHVTVIPRRSPPAWRSTS
jgi:hypothetical protein